MKIRWQGSGVLFVFVAVIVTLSFAGCASMREFRTSREVVLEDPPYYHGRISVENLQDATIGCLPIALAKRTDDRQNQEVWQTLLARMNAFLESQTWTMPLEPIDLPIDEAPDLYVGNGDMMGAPVRSSAFSDEDESIPRMMLFSQDGSRAWRNELSEVADREGVDYVIFLTLGLSEYLVRQKDWMGKKELALGTGYRMPVKWLSSLEDPVTVLHVTGALLGKDGKIHRVGAEGILAAETASFLESVIGLRNTLGEDAVKGVATDLRRQDLAGKPLAYEVTIQNLVAGLLQRNDLLVD